MEQADTSIPTVDARKIQHRTGAASAFSLEDPLMPELLSWISCAAVLGGLAASAAVASCCEAIRQATGCAPAQSWQQDNTDSDLKELQFDEQSAMHEESTQAGQALEKAS